MKVLEAERYIKDQLKEIYEEQEAANIAGLAIGITCSLLILLWVHDELSFNTFIPKADRLYQVYVNSTFDGRVNTWNSLPLPSYEGLKPEHAKLVNTCATDWGGDHLLTVAGKSGDETFVMNRGPSDRGDADDEIE